jgi:hypothetical protein
MESLLLYEIDPSETSKILANNIIRALHAQPPSYASTPFLEVNARWLNGNALCDCLGLGRPSLYYWLLMAGQCIFFTSICYTYRSVPYLDRRKIRALRGIFWNMIVENKKYGLGEESVFDFKYVPDFHVMTVKEGGEVGALEGPGVERRNLKALIYAVVVMAGVGWVGVKVASKVFGVIGGLVGAVGRLL